MHDFPLSVWQAYGCSERFFLFHVIHIMVIRRARLPHGVAFGLLVYCAQDSGSICYNTFVVYIFEAFLQFSLKSPFMGIWRPTEEKQLREHL